MTRVIIIAACAIVLCLPVAALSQNYMGYGGATPGMPAAPQQGYGNYQSYPNYNSYANQNPTANYGQAYQNYQQPSMPGGSYQQQQPTYPGAYGQQANPYASYQQQGSYRGGAYDPRQQSFNDQDMAGASLVEDGIYWDGSNSVVDEEDARAAMEQYQPPASQRRPQRVRRATRRTPRRSTQSTTIRAPRRSPGASVLKNSETKSAKSESAPSRTVVQWGKKAKRTETKSSLQWGKAGKPTMVGAEPGAPNESAQQNAPEGVSVQAKEASPKLQWGKKNQ